MGKNSHKRVDEKVKQWGAVKFKPTSKNNKGPILKNDRAPVHKNDGAPIHKNPFSQPQNFNRFNDNSKRGNDRHQKNGDNERVRFNPIARDARPENATPWSNFKDDINYKHREEEQATKQANMDTEEAKQILKQREMNYRKMIMDRKKQEPTTWEDFGENPSSNNNQEGGKKRKKKNSQAAKDEVKETEPEENNDQSEPKRKKTFDAANLNFEQKNHIRSFITKSVCAGRSTLADKVKNMKFQLKNKKLRSGK